MLKRTNILSKLLRAINTNVENNEPNGMKKIAAQWREDMLFFNFSILKFDIASTTI
jgi:biotin-(acetyl-CoA carboxylase) ligase